MRLLFAGTPEVALPSLHRLVDSSHEIVAVLTRPDARRGRGRGLTPSPVSVFAQERGIEILTPPSLRDPGAQAAIAGLGAEAAAVVAYGALVPAALIDALPHGWVNLHFSLLPAWRGAAPVQHAIIAGDDLTGASTFRIEPGLDTGPVYGTLTEPIGARDTAGELLDRLSGAGAELLLRTIDAMADGSVVAVDQSGDGVSHAPRLQVSDAQVRWTDPAIAIDRLVRGCTPAPGAWTTIDGARLKLGPLRPCSEVTDLAPGRLRRTGQEVLVGTATSAVVLGELAPAGRSWMPAAAWARGARLDPDARLGA